MLTLLFQQISLYYKKIQQKIAISHKIKLQEGNLEQNCDLLTHKVDNCGNMHFLYFLI